MTHVLVIGDCMLDVDCHHKSERRSPEGVPVVRIESTAARLGGASAVAAMCRELGATCDLVGAIGTDEESKTWWKLGYRAGIRRQVIQIPGRPTTLKKRIFVDGVQTMRIDQECRDQIPAEMLTQQATSRFLQTPDVILWSDYGKGVFSRELFLSVLDRFPGVPVIVDPALRRFWADAYNGARLIVPNEVEWNAHQQGINTPPQPKDGGHRNIPRLDFGMRIVIKYGDGGITLFEDGKGVVSEIPGIHVQAVDCCGAGDQVLAALGIAIARGSDWLTAARFANAAGAAKVQKQGATPVTLKEIENVSNGEFPEDRFEGMGQRGRIGEQRAILPQGTAHQPGVAMQSASSSD